MTSCYEGIRASQTVETFENDVRSDEAHTIIQQAFQPPGLVLDIGCGAGRYCYFLRSLGHTAVGMDLACRHLARFAGHMDRVHFLGGSGSALPIASNSVDYVLIVGIVYEILDATSREELFREIARVLKKPTGVCLYVDNMFPNVHIKTRALLGRILKDTNKLVGIGPKMMAQSIVFSHRDIAAQFALAQMVVRSRWHCNVGYGVAHWTGLLRKRGIPTGSYKDYVDGGTTLNAMGRLIASALRRVAPVLGSKSCCYLATFEPSKE